MGTAVEGRTVKEPGAGSRQGEVQGDGVDGLRARHQEGGHRDASDILIGSAAISPRACPAETKGRVHSPTTFLISMSMVIQGEEAVVARPEAVAARVAAKAKAERVAARAVAKVRAARHGYSVKEKAKERKAGAREEPSAIVLWVFMLMNP